MFPFDGSLTGMVIWTALVLVLGFFLGGLAWDCSHPQKVAQPITQQPKDKRALLAMDIERAMAHANRLMSHCEDDDSGTRAR